MMKATARRAAEVMLAYANGEKIECISRVDDTDAWEDVKNPLFQWGDYDYRVKPTRAVANMEDCLAELQKHRPYGYLKHKESDFVVAITGLDDVGLMLADFIADSHRFAYGGIPTATSLLTDAPLC